MKKTTLFLLVIVGIGIFVGRNEIGALVAAPPTPQASVPAGSVQLLPPVNTRLVLLDPTTSTDVTFREAMKALLVASVQTYVPAKPELTKDGVPPLTGLHLVVTLVGTSPLRYGAPIYSVDIPSVPELPVRADMTAVGALDPGGPYDQWKKAEAAWAAQYDAAITAAQQATTLLGGMDLELDEQSAISAGLASLSLIAPAQGGDISYLVMSDLDENRPEEAAAFNGASFLVVQPDPSGDRTRWEELFGSFSAWATANGAGPVDRVRPEAADAAVTSFIQGS